jgi:hypothetical protein
MIITGRSCTAFWATDLNQRDSFKVLANNKKFPQENAILKLVLQ